MLETHFFFFALQYCVQGICQRCKAILLRNPHCWALIDHFIAHVGAMLETHCLCSIILWSRYMPEVQSLFAEESSLLGIDWSFCTTSKCNAWNKFFFCSTILRSSYMPEVQSYFAKESSLLGIDWLFFTAVYVCAMHLTYFFFAQQYCDRGIC